MGMPRSLVENSNLSSILIILVFQTAENGLRNQDFAAFIYFCVHDEIIAYCPKPIQCGLQKHNIKRNLNLFNSMRESWTVYKLSQKVFGTSYVENWYNTK